MFIASSHQTRTKLRRSGMFRDGYIPLLAELDSIWHVLTINISLLRSLRRLSYVELTLKEMRNDELEIARLPVHHFAFRIAFHPL